MLNRWYCAPFPVAVLTQSRTVAAASPVRLALPWTLGSLAMAMGALLGYVPVWTLAIFAGCAAWRFWLERTGGELPSMLGRLAVFGPAALGVFFTFGSNPGAPGMLAFLTALLSLKVLEVRTPRDITVISLLGYFMTLSAFFYDQSLALNLYLGVALMANTVGLIRCHARSAGGLRLALGISAQALPLAVLLFLIFPRLEGNFLRRLGGASTGLTGMSEHLEPGSVASLVQSDLPAFQATIYNNQGGMLPARSLYWRGLALDICEGGLAWHARAALPYTNPPAAAKAVGRIKQEIILRPHGQHWLFALDHPVEVAPSKALHPRLIDTDTLRSESPVINKAIYTVYSQLTPTTDPGVMSPERRNFYTHLPPGLSPQTQQLVAQLTRGAKSEEDVVRAAEHFFRDGGFTYTLQPGVLPPATALDTFLFKTRKGFCEHFAAAFSTLMRASGIPARIVVGYQGGEFNTWGRGFYNVKQSDAHAWSEIWVDHKGWEREDPTAVVAPERVSFGAESFAELSALGSLNGQSRLDQLSRLSGRTGWRWLVRNAVLAWQSVDQQWNLLVLGYNQDQQETLMDGFLTLLKKVGINEIGWLGAVTMALLAVFSLLGLGTLGMLALDRTRVREDPAIRLYARFCRRAGAAGAGRRAEAEGPLDFALRAAAALPESGAQIRAVTESYIATRYEPESAGALSRLRSAVAAFRPRKGRAA